MGLSALTRRGWKENPRKQGRWNVYVSIFAIIFGTIVNLLLGEDVEDILSWRYLGIMGLFLLWGLFSLLMGILLDKTNGN